MVEEVVVTLSAVWSATSTPPTTTTTVPKQRCWAHLLRDIHDLRSLYPDDQALAQWADAVHQLYCQAKAFTPSGKSSATPREWLWNGN